MLFANHALGQTPTCGAQQFVAPDGVNVDYFGTLAFNGNYLVVGSSHHDIFGANEVGAIYPYVFTTESGWVCQEKIIPTNASEGETFAESLDIDGRILAVGAPRFNQERGRVHIYEYDVTTSQWLFQQHIQPTLTASGSFFGGHPLYHQCVKVNRNRIAVSAPLERKGLLYEAGAVYIFEQDVNNNWVQAKRLDAGTEAELFGGFGISIDLQGDRLVVGAPRHDAASAADAGAVYVYLYNSSASDWELEQKITLDTTTAYDRFGFSVAIDGDGLVVGSQSQQSTKYAAVFRRNNGVWTQDSVFTRSVSGEMNFGYAVDIDGDTILVGDPSFDQGSGLTSGGVFVYKKQTNGSWLETLLLLPDNAASDANDQFGATLILRGDKAWVGAIRGEPNSESSGSTHGEAFGFKNLPTCDDVVPDCE